MIGGIPLKDIITFILTLAAGACVIIGLVLLGVTKAGMSQGGAGDAVTEGRMMGCFVGAAALGAAAAVSANLNWTFSA